MVSGLSADRAGTVTRPVQFPATKETSPCCPDGGKFHSMLRTAAFLQTSLHAGRGLFVIKLTPQGYNSKQVQNYEKNVFSIIENIFK